MGSPASGPNSTAVSPKTEEKPKKHKTKWGKKPDETDDKDDIFINVSEDASEWASIVKFYGFEVPGEERSRSRSTSPKNRRSTSRSRSPRKAGTAANTVTTFDPSHPYLQQHLRTEDVFEGGIAEVVEWVAESGMGLSGLQAVVKKAMSVQKERLSAQKAQKESDAAKNDDPKKKEHSDNTNPKSTKGPQQPKPAPENAPKIPKAQRDKLSEIVEVTEIVEEDDNNKKVTLRKRHIKSGSAICVNKETGIQAVVLMSRAFFTLYVDKQESEALLKTLRYERDLKKELTRC